MLMKTLHVKEVSIRELMEHGWPVGAVLSAGKYIRCNAKGQINWDKAPIYTTKELIERNNVKILS